MPLWQVTTKAPGQALRLALVLELLWWAGGSDELPEPEAVSAEALGAALTLIEEYFKPMLQRVLGEAALPVVDRHAAILARAIQQRKPTQINIRQVCRKWRLPGMREAEVVKAAVNALEDAGWLIALPAREGATSGRKRQDYAVDPRIFGGQP